MFHSLVLLFKTKMDKRPAYIYEQIGVLPGRNTRQEADRVGSHLLKDIRNLETGTAKKTFIPRTIDDWNALPISLREIKSLRLFKIKLKNWIKETSKFKNLVQ